jgi:hypothetical protein
MSNPIRKRAPLADSFSKGLEITRLQAQVQAKSLVLLAKIILLIGLTATGFWVWHAVETMVLIGAARWSAAWLIVDVLRADWTGFSVLTDAGRQTWAASRVLVDPWHRAAFAETLAALRLASAVCLLLAMPLSVLAYWGAWARGRNASADLLARGQKVVDAGQLARLVRRRGGVSAFAIGPVPLPEKALNRSILCLGAPQTGKSLTMKRMLREVRRRGDIAIVFDKVGDFTAEFHDQARGDVLLNPLDARSPDWSPWAEMRDIADAYRMAKSLIPSVEGANNFFHIGAQDLFATLLTRIWRMPDRSLLGLLTCALVMDRKDKAKLLARTAAAKHYEGDHRSGQDVDATMSVYTQALRFLPQTAGGAQDFSIRDFIADAVTRREQAPEAALDAIHARFRAEIAELQKARSLLAAGELRAAFRLIARVTIAYPLLPDGMVAPDPAEDFGAWWEAHGPALKDHWAAQDATLPAALAALEAAHAEATARLAAKGAPWLFIASTQRQLHAVRPVLSLWLDAVADTIMSLPDNRARRIWLFLDELQALQQLPSLQPLLTEGAKYGVCVVAGVQNLGQLRQSYGRDAAEVILSLFNTKAFFRLQEPDTAKWVEGAIGAAVKEHVHESIRFATSETMDGASLGIQRTTEPIVMAGEIIRLDDLNLYLMLPGDWPVGRIRLAFDPRRDSPAPKAAALVPQPVERTIFHALDRLGWTPIPDGTDGEDPGEIARSTAAPPERDGTAAAPGPRQATAEKPARNSAAPAATAAPSAPSPAAAADTKPARTDPPPLARPTAASPAKAPEPVAQEASAASLAAASTAPAPPPTEPAMPRGPVSELAAAALSAVTNSWPDAVAIPSGPPSGAAPTQLTMPLDAVSDGRATAAVAPPSAPKAPPIGPAAAPSAPLAPGRLAATGWGEAPSAAAPAPADPTPPPAPAPRRGRRKRDR